MDYHLGTPDRRVSATVRYSNNLLQTGF